MKIQTYLVAISVLLFFSLTGCVRAYRVDIDSIRDKSAALNKVYQILPGNKDISAGDLQFKEFAGYLVKTLSSEGYVLANSPKEAEIEIYLSYGVGEPEKHTYSYYEPVYGQTGAEIYTRTNQVVNSDNTTSEYSTTYVEPQFGVTSYSTQTGEYTVYKKYAILDAFDIKNGIPGAKLKEMWKTSISTTGKSNSLRKVFPVLMAASSKYIGSNTGEELSVDIAEDSEKITILKQ